MRLTNTTPQTLMPGETIRRREKPQPQTPSRPSASTPPAPAVPAATNRHRPRRPPAPNTRRQLRRLHNLVDDIHKRLPHVLPCQRTDLGEEGAVRLGERAALFRRDLAALGCLVELGADLFVPFSQDLRGRQVSGVRGGGEAYQMQRNVLGGVGFGLEEPPLHGKERRSVGDVVHEEDAVRAAVEAGGEGAEALLAGLGGGLAGGSLATTGKRRCVLCRRDLLGRSCLRWSFFGPVGWVVRCL